ncbi:MAG: ABC transporter ATP-binding protein [Pseudomonadota bacterium]
MTDIVIKAENLGKMYTIGHQAERGGYTALRDVLMQNVRTLWNKTKDLATGKPIIQGDTLEEVWALKDVNFEIRRGEAVGIIGRNGAGKSTLLKILSRITEPSTGRVTIKGRVASLLEVGTGFHPELSGRENIYLNGTILGMTRAEIKQKFDEIVAFAEVEKYLDTPVKRYSSGMYVRLAFAVASHLEPEILVVDEVLAVGDAQFQKKCLGKMENVGREGRTVLFVSHNMSAIAALCTKAICLNRGMIDNIGIPAEIISTYLKSLNKSDNSAVCNLEYNDAKEFQVTQAKLSNNDGLQTSEFTCDEPVHILLNCLVREKVPGLYGYMTIEKTDGSLVLESDSYDIKPNLLDSLPCGKHLIRISIPPRSIGVGDYLVYLNFTSLSGKKNFNIDSPGHVLSFYLEDPLTSRVNNRRGFLSTCLKWDVTSV